MEPSAGVDVAAVTGGLAAGLVALAPRRVLLLAALAGFVIAEIALGLMLLSDTEQDTLMSSLRRLEIVLPAILLFGALVVGFVRWPGATPVALLAAAPFRVPVDVGSDTVYLLLPLYGVLGAALLALAYRSITEDDLPSPPLLLAGPTALIVVLAGLSMLWASDVRSAGIDLVFFYLPFAALFGTVARMRAARWTEAALAVTLVTLGCLFAAIGLVQVRTGDLPFARDIEVANEYTSYTRVTSLFHDPSIYGRHLAIAISILVVLLWLRRVRILIALPILALLAAGLFVSYSQSSMVALFVSVLAVSLLAADPRARRILVTASVAAAVVTVVIVAVLAWNQSLSRTTSGRSDLVTNTAYVIAANPVIGVGIGGEEQANREEGEKRGLLPKSSHTTPLTVAAELGVLGVAAYLLFLAASARGLLLLSATDRPLALSLAAVLIVLVVHSLFYSGFFEDPITWGSVGLAAAGLTVSARAAPRNPSEQA
jgi:O-antigen ligase